MRVILALFLCVFLSASELNSTANADINASSAQKSIEKLKVKLKNIDNSLNNNIWVARYANYGIYQSLQTRLQLAQSELEKSKDKALKSELERKIASLKSQLEVLKDYESSPFTNLLALPSIEETPKITNPIALIAGFSHLKHLKALKVENAWILNELNAALGVLNEKQSLINELYKSASFKLLDANAQSF